MHSSCFYENVGMWCQIRLGRDTRRGQMKKALEVQTRLFPVVTNRITLPILMVPYLLSLFYFLSSPYLSTVQNDLCSISEEMHYCCQVSIMINMCMQNMIRIKGVRWRRKNNRDIRPRNEAVPAGNDHPRLSKISNARRDFLFVSVTS